jgi:hypothetical protein
LVSELLTKYYLRNILLINYCFDLISEAARKYPTERLVPDAVLDDAISEALKKAADRVYMR